MKFGSSGYGMEIGSWLLWVFLQLSLKLSLPVFQKHCLLLFPDRSAENTGSKSADLSLPPVKGSQVSSISLSLWVLYYLYVALFQSALSNKTKPICSLYFLPFPAFTGLSWVTGKRSHFWWLNAERTSTRLQPRKPSTPELKLCLPPQV